MNILIKQFIVTIWEFDKSFFEWKDKTRSKELKQNMTCKWNVSPGNNPSIPLKLLKLEWLYNFRNKDSTEHILKFVVADEYFIYTDGWGNEAEELDNALKNSYIKYSGEFDKRKVSIKHRNVLPVMPPQVFIDLRQAILEDLHKEY